MGLTRTGTLTRQSPSYDAMLLIKPVRGVSIQRMAIISLSKCLSFTILEHRVWIVNVHTPPYGFT